jgi:alkylation response protein AidB-like acyl-CoA dehydrogenase
MMRFLETDEQQAFAEAIDEIVEGHGGTDIPRSWAAGDTATGVALWNQFAELGLTGLRLAEDEGGLGGSAADLTVVFERLGYHAAPGPYLESIALLPRLVDPEARAALAAGAMATASVAGVTAAALDAETATARYAITGAGIAEATDVEPLESIAPTRRIARLTAGESVPVDADALSFALDEASLTAAAQLVGIAARLVEDAVSYALLREQFGRPIGEFQAVKHQLADAHVAVSFARPLVRAAAVGFDGTDRARAVSAAKVAAGDAAHLAARTALQVHGAIGYTAEHHLGLWLGLVPALRAAWGTAGYHRARVARSILSAGTHGESA